MMPDAERYRYSSLSGPRSTRVVVLQPSLKRSDAIQCSFLEISLDDERDSKHQYEALSYTWGAPQGTKPVLCDGQTILVTPNCEEALLHLRRKFQPRHLWIDAVCIDQQSVTEKNIQVPLMSDIYCRADRTIMWLGADTDPDMTDVLRRASRYGSYVNALKSGYRSIRGRASNEIRHTSSWTAPILSPTETERIFRLLSNPWFTRMWTIQEFLLSKSSVFRLGDVKCSSDDLLTYYHMGKNLVKRTDLEHFRMRNILLDFVPSVASEYFLDFINLVINLVVLNNSTDPRDKVYGILAYLKRNCPDLELAEVDYAKPLSEVFELFTRSIIAATGDLWALELVNSVTQSDTTNSSEKIPSWTIDLRDSQFIALPSSSERKINPPEDIPWILSQPYIPGQLRILSKKIGRVSRVSSRMSWWNPKLSDGYSAKEMDLARTDCLSEWTAFATSLDLDDKLVADCPYRLLATRKIAKDKWRYSSPSLTTTEPCDDPHARALHQITEVLDYLRLRHEPINKDTVSVASDEYWYIPEEKRGKRAEKAMKERRRKQEEAWKENSFFDGNWNRLDRSVLFLSEQGYLGLCEGDVQVGDGIFRVDGSKSEFMLRRTGRGREHIVVGKTSLFRPGTKEPDGIKLGDTGVKEIVLV